VKIATNSQKAKDFWMRVQISRRDFLKAMGLGVASAVLTGCGPISRYVKREPYLMMPEYTYNGLSTFYATTCRECPAGCGTIIRTMQGRALKVEGNKNHPVSRGKTCARGQAAVQALYNPDRIQYPAFRPRRGTENLLKLSWNDAVGLVSSTFKNFQPGEIAFLLGLTSDHLADLITEITDAIGAPPPLRYGAFAMFEARATLANAANQIFGISSIPFFDIANADITFSFNANFLETYHSPVAYARGFATMRQGHSGRRGYFVQFEPRMSQTAAVADEWIPILPGSEGLVSLAIGRLVAEERNIPIPEAYSRVDTAQIAQISGVSEDQMRRLAQLFSAAEHPLAIPGGAALAAGNGLEAAKAILTLNVLMENLGKNGGIFLIPPLPVNDTHPLAPNTMADMQGLVNQINNGKIKALFIHGVNPVFELPASIGFTQALDKITQMVSFSSFPDETALQADYVFPDHTSLESWGYQKIITGTDRPVISAQQPVVAPFHDTHATADVFLAAIQAFGGDLAAKIPYLDEVEYLQHSVQNLVAQNGFFNAQEINSFWVQWQQNGGWWNQDAGLGAPTAMNALSAVINPSPPQYDGDGEFYLFPFPSPLLSDGTGANKPWLQEIPDPMTTVVWNTWVEIHPETADRLGVSDDDVVRIISPYGRVEASVYRYPAIRPDTIAIPFGQGHTAYGRYASDRGINLVHLLGFRVNPVGDLIYPTIKVKIEKTGKTRPLARFESRLGVYETSQGG
jgi:anaerobic selenocysteine-containing dehydrogenase